MGRSMALKCTYNDGGEGVLVGFSDTCSLDNIDRNMSQGRVWCSQPQCACRAFYDAGLTGTRPHEPCYESHLFSDWRFGAGVWHSGPRSGTPIHMSSVEEGKFAVLTTRFPGEREAERRIVGLFQIGHVDEERETIIYAASRARIRLAMEEARELYFWAYYRNEHGGPIWGTHLFRYLEDSQVHRILADLRMTVRDERVRAEIDYVIDRSFGGAEAPQAAGALPQKSVARPKTMALVRKYGTGGEGRDHKDLKLWLSRHPEALGLVDVMDTEVEHVYMCGDSADLVFHHSGGRHTVVEVETTNSLPGAHQAVKYRALLCAEKGYPLTSEKVKAILVAWSIPEDVRAFCEQYDIDVQAHRLSSRTPAEL